MISAQHNDQSDVRQEGDPHQLAALARTRMEARHDGLVESLTSIFDGPYCELVGMPLDEIVILDSEISRLTAWPPH